MMTSLQDRSPNPNTRRVVGWRIPESARKSDWNQDYVPGTRTHANSTQPGYCILDYITDICHIEPAHDLYNGVGVSRYRSAS